MRVSTFGINVQAGHDRVSLAEVFASMKSKNGQPDDSRRIQRRFYIDDTDQEFYRGLVITVRDQNAFCKWVESGSKVTIQVQNLGEAEKIMDFNLFVIRKENGLGLYQYYHRSCPLNTFVTYLKREYRAISDKKRDAALAVAEERNASSREIKSIKAQFGPALRGGPLVTAETFASVLQEYGEIRGFSFEVTSVAQRTNVAGPLDPYIKRIRQSVAFSVDASKNGITSAIGQMLGSINTRTARVSVLNDDEEAVALRLENIPTKFGEVEYDDLAAELQDLDVEGFASAGIVDGLISKCRERPHIFNQEFG